MRGRRRGGKYNTRSFGFKKGTALGRARYPKRLNRKRPKRFT